MRINRTLFFGPLAIAASTFVGVMQLRASSGAEVTDTTYHYEPIPGKTVCVWPDEWSIERMRYLRTQYGFSSIFVGADALHYANALQAGFTPATIIVGISGENYRYAADSLPAGTYYLDEPVEHDCYGYPTAGYLYSPQELAARRDYIHSHRPGALFAIGGYKRCSHNRIAATYADLMLYPSYMNWDELGIPACHVNIGWGDDWENPWLPGNSDQRNSWTSMRQVYGAKFSNTWIHGGGDEYDVLFAHATTLGLTGMWQFNRAPIDSARLVSFCVAAWQNGWLQRVPDVPVPIQLAWFNATVVSQTSVRLHWLTLSEINNYGFFVQRRSLFQMEFETLPNSFIPGHGTTLEPHEYEFIDSNAFGHDWFYRLKQVDLNGTIHYSEPIRVDMATSVSGDGSPSGFVLLRNHPNPFNPSTTISFQLPSSGVVSVKIFDFLGREVAVLVDDREEAGNHEVTWDARPFSSGVYVCQLTAGSSRSMLKLVLIR